MFCKFIQVVAARPCGLSPILKWQFEFFLESTRPNCLFFPHLGASILKKVKNKNLSFFHFDFQILLGRNPWLRSFAEIRLLKTLLKHSRYQTYFVVIDSYCLMGSINIIEPLYTHFPLIRADDLNCPKISSKNFCAYLETNAVC